MPNNDFTNKLGGNRGKNPAHAGAIGYQSQMDRRGVRDLIPIDLLFLTSCRIIDSWADLVQLDVSPATRRLCTRLRTTDGSTMQTTPPFKPTKSANPAIHFRAKQRKANLAAPLNDRGCALLRLRDDRYQLAPPDKNWEIANAIFARTAPHSLFREEINADVTHAVTYIQERAHKHFDFSGPLADLDRAFQLRFAGDRLTRAVLESRILSGETAEEISAKCSLPITVCRLYESLFFDVRDKIRHQVYIFAEAIGVRYWSGFTEEDVDIILKSLAYLKGPMFLDYVLPYFTTTWNIPDQLDKLSKFELEQLQFMASIRALINAMTLPAEKAVAANDRLLAGEPATQWESLASELEIMIVSERARHPISTSLSPASTMRLVDTFAFGQAATKSNNGEEMPRVALAG